MPVRNVLFSILEKSAAPCDKQKCECERVCLDISKEKYVWNKRNGHNVFIVVAFDTPIQMLPNILTHTTVHTIQQNRAVVVLCCMVWMNGKWYQFSVTKYKTFIKKKIVQQQQQRHRKKDWYLTNETKSKWRHVTNITHYKNWYTESFCLFVVFIMCFSLLSNMVLAHA